MKAKSIFEEKATRFGLRFFLFLVSRLIHKCSDPLSALSLSSMAFLKGKKKKYSISHYFLTQLISCHGKQNIFVVQKFIPVK